MLVITKREHELTILTTLLIYFSLKIWENVLFELGSERVKIIDGNEFPYDNPFISKFKKYILLTYK